MIEPAEDSPLHGQGLSQQHEHEQPSRESRMARLARPLAIGVLALLLVLAGYYRPILRGELRSAPVTGDAAFYAYQFARAGELSGQWWKLGSDDLIGAPYQPVFGKHPGIFEGVDLLLASSVTSRWLDPLANYHVLMALVLVLNGLVVGMVVHRLTRSWACTALGVVLITWNYSTVFRMQGHSHLFKYGWTVLAALALSDYLDRPSVRRGILLGLAVALVLQGSCYIGFFVVMTFGLWWLGCLASGKIGRAHVAATWAAVLSCVLAGAVFTFPVWAVSRTSLLADAYQGHMRTDAWQFSADLWQYFVPPVSKLGRDYLADFNSRLKSPKTHLEGWHYPGATVLLAIAIYLAFRLRGATLPVQNPRLLDRFMGLTGILVLISLAGGPSFFLLSGIGCFRAYGRAGLPALALWCVAAPVILHAALGRTRRVWVRPAALIVLLTLGLLEGFQATGWNPVPCRATRPDWVDWLAKQPSSIRLAAFPPSEDGFDSLLYRSEHGHACFNGADTLLLDSDLKLLGASHERMNPAGLRFIISLGYETLCFHREYLAANPWISSMPGLEPFETSGDWSFYRATARLERMPPRSLGEVVALWASGEGSREVPAGSWITERFDLDRDVVIGAEPRHYLAWADAWGKLLDTPVPALFQHLYGPGMPAFSIKTPRSPGQCRLIVLDPKKRVIASRGYTVRPDLETGLRHIEADRSGFRTTATVLTSARVGEHRTELVIENDSPCFIQASTSRDQVYLKSMRVHPLAMRQAPGSLSLELRWIPQEKDRAAQVVDCPLPRDLSPGGRVTMSLPRDILSGELRNGRIEIVPRFHGRPEQLVDLTRAELRVLAVPSAPGSTGSASPAQPLRR